MNDKENIEKKEKKNKWLIILILLLILLLLGAAIVIFNLSNSSNVVDIEEPQMKPIFEPDEEKEIITRNEPGELRARINPVVYVKHDTMQNLELYNLNSDRFLICELYCEDEKIYTSDFIREGEMLKGDVIKTDCLQKGDNEVTVEISSYNLDKQKVGQTNVLINLVLK